MIHGLQATRFLGSRLDAQGASQPIAATVIRGPGENVFLLQALAKDGAALQRSAAPLREAEGSFRGMTQQDVAGARPWQIKTLPYPRGGFSELAATSPLPAAERQLRLINGYYGGGEPKQGQTVKVVVTH